MTTCQTESPVGPRKLTGGDLLLAAAMTAAAVVLTGDAWLDNLRIAINDEDMGYVLVAPAVIAWLAWVRRHRFAGCRARGGWIGVILIAVSWLTYWYGYHHGDRFVWRIGSVLLAVGGCLAVLGTDVLIHFRPAFGACLFLIPLSLSGRYNLASPLQRVTAACTERMCELFGISVERFGNLLTANGVDIAIVEACSGMRMVLTLFLVCYVVAFVLPLHGYVRALLLLASPVIAVAFNVVRLVPTVWVYGNRPAAFAESFHGYMGWAMSVAAFVVLMAVLKLFQRLKGPATGASPAKPLVYAS